MKTPRPGGRTARTRAAVFEATLRLLQEQGAAAISMADIAGAAGIAATSLYRRWGSLDVLLLDVAIEKLRTGKPIPDTGSLAGDLTVWGQGMVSGLLKPDHASIFMVLVASVARMGASREQRAQAIEPRVAQIRQMLQRAQDRGEATPSVAEVRDYFAAPLYIRALFGGELNKRCVDHLVEHLMTLSKSRVVKKGSEQRAFKRSPSK